MRWVSSYLAFPPLPRRIFSAVNMLQSAEYTVRRYISVALVRGSPLAGVTRYPCPAEPGLSSRTGFRLVPAAVRPAHVRYFTPEKLHCQTERYECIYFVI